MIMHPRNLFHVIFKDFSLQKKFGHQESIIWLRQIKVHLPLRAMCSQQRSCPLLGILGGKIRFFIIKERNFPMSCICNKTHLSFICELKIKLQAKNFIQKLKNVRPRVLDP